jgi:hypothetical protein
MPPAASTGPPPTKLPGLPSAAREFTSIWQGADKIVHSTTLTATASARTRIERTFDRAAIRQLKSVAGHDMTLGGADLAYGLVQA